MECTEDPIELLLLRHSEGLYEIKKLIAGGVAGCTAKTAVAPLSRVTILMQVQSMRPHKFADGVNPNNVHFVAGLAKIYREEGFGALWRGNLATLVHRFPYAAVTFYANASCRQRLERLPWSPAVPEQARAVAAGGCSASLAVLLCYPLDVVKARLITQTRRQYYNGILDALWKITRDEGFSGLYRGLGMTLASVVPCLAMNFALYEQFLALYSGSGPPLPPYLHPLLAGGSSGAAASALFFPVDLLRRQMQLVGLGGRPRVYENVLQATRHVYSTGCRRYEGWYFGPVLGLREFFRGLAPELVKVTPASALMFCIHNQLLRLRWPFER